MEKITLNNKTYDVIKLLGKGKGGYSYLVELDGNKYCLKQIHHEPCSYYTFSDKLQSELNDYNTLKDLIRLPKLIEYDKENERILKQYIDGKRIDELVKSDNITPDIMKQLYKFLDILYKNNLNIDYYPTNFIVEKGMLYYIDYECNKYMEKWNFENWGIKYWNKTKEFLESFKD